MTEPLVRIGRNDLWPRYATEERDGRIVAKEGEKPAVILTTTLAGDACCAYQHHSDLWLVRTSGLTFSDCEHRTDLIELSPAPTIEPWEWHEIPVKHWFRDRRHIIAHPVSGIDISLNRILINGRWVGTDKLLDDYEHCPTHCGEFDPCGKVV